MKLSVRGHGVRVSDGLRDYLERHVYFALSRFSDRLSSVNVTFADANGPRGGVDKVCRVRVKLRAGAEVCVEAVDPAFEPAVDRACDRVARQVARELERKRVFARAPAWAGFQ